MKFLTSFIIALGFQTIYAQSDSSGTILCDSVVMVDGSVNVVQIQEVKNRKLIYTLCCEDCSVPREFKLKNVDTLIYNFFRKSKEVKNDFDNEQVIEENKLDSSIIFLRHAKREKTIYLGLGDKIKISGPRVEGKGKIVSISKNIISIKPRKKKLDVIDSIDVSQLYWIKKYNKNKFLRATSAFLSLFGATGVGFFGVMTWGVIESGYPEFLYITVPSTLLSSGIILGAYYMKGGRKYIGDEKWQVVEQTN